MLPGKCRSVLKKRKERGSNREGEEGREKRVGSR
jgi:hypothetical protein